MKLDQSAYTLLDGPLLPNDAIDAARAIALDEPDDLAVLGQALFVSCGKTIVRVRNALDPAPETVAQFQGRVTSICGFGEQSLAVTVEGEGLYALSTNGGERRLLSAAEPLRNAVTASTLAANGVLLITRATTRPGSHPFAHELFQSSGTGQLLRVGQDGDLSVLTEGLRGPHGVAVAPSGDILVGETWAASVGVVTGSGPLTTVIANFAGYPGRMKRRDHGGFTVACLAKRDPLVDFVRSERAFVDRMTRELPPEQWIAPRLSRALDANAPVQAGAARLYGHVKPWAPSLSYGLICEFDDRFVPIASHHSRANGTRHGITSALEWSGVIAAVSKASAEVVFLQSGNRSNG